MTHWAEIDENNKVIRVTVGDNNDPANDKGYQWLIDNLGGRWIETSTESYGGISRAGGPCLRKNYAGVGYTYDEVGDAFYASSPYPSWVLNKATYLWEAPTPKPTDNKQYGWDEENQTWFDMFPEPTE